MIRILSLTLAVLTLILVGLGSYVRVTGAGLACPDWPLCFGEVVPPMEVGVFQEVAHRYLAGIVVILTIVLFSKLWKIRHSNPWGVKLGVFALVLLVVQSVFGALTVLLRLQPSVVTTHLALGTLFLQLMLLFVVGAKKRQPSPMPESRGFIWATGIFVALFVVQILLGGYVSTGGAALACPAFPHCGAGDVLYKPQILQLTHRTTAYVLALFSIGLLVAVLRNRNVSKRARILSAVTLFLMVLQIGFGIMNVYARISPKLSVIHQVLAQGILFHALLIHGEFNRRFLAKFFTSAQRAVELTDSEPAQQVA
jgi:heme A synthase